MLLQISGDVEVFTAIAVALLEGQNGSAFSLNHYIFSNAKNRKLPCHADCSLYSVAATVLKHSLVLTDLIPNLKRDNQTSS